MNFKIIKALSLGVAIFTLSVAAQEAKAQTGHTMLNVNITPVISLSVNQASTDLNFNTYNDYITGVSTIQQGHLTVTSTTPYHINVKTENATLAGSSQSIPASSIHVIQDGDPTGLGTPVERALSTTDQAVISNADATIDKQINIKYLTHAGDTNFLNKGAGAYTVKVIYSAVAD